MNTKSKDRSLAICLLGKFFPTQGGMAASLYWQADALSKKNIDVKVISNGNLVEDQYRIKTGQTKELSFDACYIENLIEYYIPFREQDIASLVEKFLSINNKIDIIDAQYLLPFGIVAYFIHLITGTPYVIRHGGSDIDKFLNKGTFTKLFTNALENAACVITDDTDVKKIAKKVKYVAPYIPNHAKFISSQKKNLDKINIAYIGKTNVLWRYKALDKMFAMFRGVKEQIDFTFLSQGKGIDDLKNSILLDYVTLKEFIPPWEMPAFYSQLDYIVFFCKSNPLPDWPCILLEAISSGVKILTDSPDFFEKLHPLVENIDEFIVHIKENITSVELLKQLEKNRGIVKPVYQLKYNDYIEDNISLYKEILFNEN